MFGILAEDRLWESLEPMPGAQETLKRLYDEGHELYMVTATHYKTCQAKFPRIRKMFPWLDTEHIIIAHKKQMIRGDVLIGDNPQNLLGGQYFRVLFDQPHNRKFQEKEHNMYRAADWTQVYDLIHANLID